jgi:hypothetical protein
MKTILRLTLAILAGLFFLFNASVHAQPLWGYQTIGTHTWYFSVSWQGKPMLGAGYNYRFFNESFTDAGIEWRFPLAEMYKTDNHQLIFGIYKPLRLKRSFTAIGVHGRISRHTVGDQTTTLYGLALSAIPSYVYSANTNDGAYGTFGARLTYQPILAAQVNKGGASTWKGLPAHRIELGGHLDVHLERTLGLATNVFATRTWATDKEILPAGADAFRVEGDFYMGTTYYLKRW